MRKAPPDEVGKGLSLAAPPLSDTRRIEGSYSRRASGERPIPGRSSPQGVGSPYPPGLQPLGLEAPGEHSERVAPLSFPAKRGKDGPNTKHSAWLPAAKPVLGGFQLHFRSPVSYFSRPSRELWITRMPLGHSSISGWHQHTDRFRSVWCSLKSSIGATCQMFSSMAIATEGRLSFPGEGEVLAAGLGEAPRTWGPQDRRECEPPQRPLAPLCWHRSDLPAPEGR